MPLNEHLVTADRSVRHDLLARTAHDAEARERYVLSLKTQVRKEFEAGQKTLYDLKVEPDFRKKKGRAPASVDEIRAAMKGEGFHQMWSALTFTGQELMWDAVGESVQNDLPRIEDIARAIRKSNRKLGSLMLNAAVKMPAYVGHIDIHGQPGGYELDESEDDVLAGALYEAGGNIYARGIGTGAHDSKAGALIAWLRREHPGLAPKRILDIGCGVGTSTVPYAEAFPDAEVYGIDVGAGLLRYAHARAEKLGHAVHFAQQNGEKTTYANGFFDLIVSHNLFHESPLAASRAILREAKRLLAPGGLLVNLDVPAQNADRDLFQQFLGDWQTLYNAEPCWRAYAGMDLKAELKDAGFAESRVFATKEAKTDSAGHWQIFGASKA